MSHYFIQHLFLLSTIALSLIAFYDKRVLQRCIFSVKDIEKGQYDRLLLSGFIHSDYFHLGFNMVTYYAFAYLWVDIFVVYFHIADWVFAVFYLSAIVIANLVVWIVYRKRKAYCSLGASGGVSAVVFACVLLFPWERLYVFFIPMPAIVFAILYIGYSVYRSIKKHPKDPINHLAHLAGALYGILFTIVIKPDVARIFIQKLLDV